MTAVLKTEAWLSPAAYLELERTSQIRHEYVGGTIQAMAGASRSHNVIAGNIFAAIHGHLRGKPCRAFMNDMRLRLNYPNGQQVYYYPDIMVTCRQMPDPNHVEEPAVIIEVLSRDTEDVDRREKFFSYTGLSSLNCYVLVDQYRRQVEVFQRADAGWTKELLHHYSDTLHLPDIMFHMSVEAIYEDAFDDATP